MAAPTVLLTGATGFIGGATLAQLLESHPACRVLLIARDRGSESVGDRVQRSLARFVGQERAAAGLRSCEVIACDLTNPADLGVPLMNEVTHRDRRRIQELLGPGDESYLLTALPIYYRFMEINADIFDNTRLREKGMPPSPKITSYLHRCATQPPDRSVYEQMLDDV